MSYTKSRLTELEYLITGAAIKVHRNLGPGLLESIYHQCMKIELAVIGLDFKSELNVPAVYNEQELNVNLRCDFLIENVIVLEIKSTEGLAPIFDAQLLTYMKLLQCPKGLLINFNCLNIVKGGKKSLVNEFYSNLKD